MDVEPASFEAVTRGDMLECEHCNIENEEIPKTIERRQQSRTEMFKGFLKGFLAFYRRARVCVAA